MQTITYGGLKLKIEEGKPIVVDISAKWCPPCEKIEPILEELIKSYDGKVEFFRIDIGSEPDVMEIGLKAVPTLLFYKNGELQDKLVGFVDKIEINDMVEKLLGSQIEHIA